ncbi:MAG: helicase-related protein, partial [Candidatus Binatus sp.]
ADLRTEQQLLNEMEQVAEAARGLPDARVLKLIEWIKSNMCAGVRVPGQPSLQPNAPWSDSRLLIFTEYEDTRRYIVAMLRAAVSETQNAEERVKVFSGTTAARDREAIKLAFNSSPSENPLRILVATDAAREGINLQAHWSNLFHFDLPWNPSRIEQRNGRIDRKLQPAEKVFCHYFFYKQRDEDRILKALWSGRRTPYVGSSVVSPRCSKNGCTKRSNFEFQGARSTRKCAILKMPVSNPRNA